MRRAPLAANPSVRWLIRRQPLPVPEAIDWISVMLEKAIYLLVVEGFADWEPAHAVAELRRHGQYRVESVGLTPAPVESMGGIRVLPSTTVTEVDPADVAVFIIPGGDRWENSPVEPETAALLKRLDARQVPLAAICAATVAISRLGLLRGRRHTSNGLEYLRSHVPGYSEAANYVDLPAVRDRGLITASGLGDVEFARELFEELNVLSAKDRADWAAMFRSARLPAGAG
jgi:putative intracellular protease/amidase